MLLRPLWRQPSEIALPCHHGDRRGGDVRMLEELFAHLAQILWAVARRIMMAHFPC